MALILAIEPDKKQASAVRALARGSLGAQMLVADSTARGLQELNGRLPDLILTSLLLSPKDEAVLDQHLRGLDTAGHRVPTLVIPVLAAVSRGSKSAGLLKRLKKPRKTTGTEACDPGTFAAQITEYLDRAAAERALDEPEPDEDDDEPPIAAGPLRVPEPVGETDEPQAYVAPMAIGRFLFASSDVSSKEITPEAIDLNAFFEELEAVVSSYQPGDAGLGAGGSDLRAGGAGQGAGTVLVAPATLPSESIVPRAEPPTGAMTFYTWPALEGLPAGTEWDIAGPGDPDYQVLTDFIEAFETSAAVPAPADHVGVAEETRSTIAEPLSPPMSVDHESWIALSMPTRYNWPPIEGVESLAVYAEIEGEPDLWAGPEGPALPMRVEVPAAPPAQWLEILTAIRRDIQELRAEHRGDVPAGSGVARHRAIASEERAPAKKPQVAAAPAAPPARKRKRTLPPKQDEWGFFDPDQCGFAALLAKLEEIEGDEPPPSPDRS